MIRLLIHGLLVIVDNRCNLLGAEKEIKEMVVLLRLKSILLMLLLPGILLQCNKHLPPGDPDNGGLVLPEGFEAVVVVDRIGSARHLAVNDNGDIYIKMRFAHEEGENIGLRDNNNDGKADQIERFGVFDQRGYYATGMRIYKDYLYYSTASTVYRQKLTRAS